MIDYYDDGSSCGTPRLVIDEPPTPHSVQSVNSPNVSAEVKTGMSHPRFESFDDNSDRNYDFGGRHGRSNLPSSDREVEIVDLETSTPSQVEQQLFNGMS